MAKNILIPYRGDLVTARHGFKANRKEKLRRFKRHLLREWNMSGRLYLWTDGSGYVNDKARELLGIEKDFMKNSSGLTGFGVELKPSADVNKILALSENDKDFLRNKCMAIFNKYGYTVKTSYKDGAFDFQTFSSDGTETEFLGQADEELASILYDRVVSYMINNDSTDTLDSWESIYGDADFFNGDARSKLKSFKYTFTSSELIKIINDRLFTKRTYKTIGGTGFFKRESTALGIDMILFNELVDNGTTDNVNGEYWSWNGSKYELRVDNITALDEEEFLIFIQTHLGTFQDTPPKKWYQKGFFGVVFAVIIVVVAVVLGQPQFIGYLATIGLGATLLYAGMVISLAGAFLGNEVMMMAGQIVSLAGGAINLYQTIAQNEMAMAAAKQLMANVGADNIAIQKIAEGVISDMVVDTALGVGKFALNTYSTIDGLLSDVKIDEPHQTHTPAEKINEIYVADDVSWDFVQRFLPDFIIASTLKVM